MSKSRSIPAALAALSVAVGCAVWSVKARAESAPEPAPQAAALTAALDAYARQDFGAAYAGLVALADAGHAQAAHIAWWMQRQGTSLYGRDFAASAAQRRAWAGAAWAMVRNDLSDHATAVADLASSVPDGCIDSSGHVRVAAQVLATKLAVRD